MPTISVVMSIYSEPVEWMRLAIDSILDQTYRDFEFIIVNDNPGRKENVSLLEECRVKDSRIVVIENEENVGLTKSLNKGLDIAKGKYIARMDADDISLPERFEKQIQFMEHNINIVASGSFIYTMNECGEVTSKLSHFTDSQEIRDKLIFTSPIYHPVSFFRRVIDGVPVRYNEARRYSQDYALWVSLAVKHNLANIPEYLLKYRESSSQISSKNHDAQQQCARLNMEDAISALGIILSTEDKNIIIGMTRILKDNLSPKDIENAIYSLLVNNKENKIINVRQTAKEFIHIYCNYLPRYYSIWYSLKRYMAISLRTRCFDFYSLMSLVNKYRLKSKI